VEIQPVWADGAGPASFTVTPLHVKMPWAPSGYPQAAQSEQTPDTPAPQRVCGSEPYAHAATSRRSNAEHEQR